MKNITPLFRFCQFFLLLFLATNCSKDQHETGLVDYNRLNEAFTDAEQIDNIKSLVIYYQDTIIKESFYGTGAADVRHDVRSVTKSVSSILIGIAIDKGYLSSVDQTLGEFIDTLVYTITPVECAIKIRHLLTMTGGFEWDETTSVSGYNNWITAENQVQYLLDKPMAHEPGTFFTYNSAASHLLSLIITKVSGMNTRDFALQYLFQPLGIQEIEWETDKQGIYNGGAGMEITPHDMIKIGKLILNQGVYNGKTILSRDYINEAILSKISADSFVPFSSGYGYCWWTGQSVKGNYAFANGYGGQFIVVVPDLNLIVVATNIWSGVGSTVANEQWYRTLDLIINKILPAFNNT